MDTQIEASATATTSRPIGIKTTYIVFDGDDGTRTTTSETFDASRNDASEARVGLPVGVEPAKSQPGDDAYSGMHDQGPLPQLKEGGPIAFLIGCARLAKEHSDGFLTKRIEEEKKKKQNCQKQKQQQQQQNQQQQQPEQSQSPKFPNKRPKQ